MVFMSFQKSGMTLCIFGFFQAPAAEVSASFYKDFNGFQYFKKKDMMLCILGFCQAPAAEVGASLLHRF